MKHPSTVGHRLLLLCTTLILCCLLPLAAMADDTIAMVTGGRLHLREEASTTSRVVATLPNHTLLTILGQEGDWYQVQTGGSDGFVEAAYVTLGAAAVVQNSGDYVNLRSSPGRGDNIVGRYASGTLVTLLGEGEGGWLSVEIEGKQGYIASEFIQPAPNAAPATQPDTLVLDTSGTPPTMEARNIASAPEALITDGAASVVHQVGQGESSAGVEGNLMYTLYYPLLNIPLADGAIAGWLDDTLAEARDLAAEATGEEAVEITVQYDSYLTADRYIGLVQTGFLDSHLLAHPADLIYTLNVDRQTGQLLYHGDIFAESGTQAVLDLLYHALSTLDGNPVEGVTLDEGWLRYTAIRPEGIDIILPRGEYMASALGTQHVLLPYDVLVNAGLLALSLGDVAVTQSPDMAAGQQPAAATPRTVDPTKPMVALTFDDGPSDYTPQILDLLAQYGGKATFCMVGNRINNYQDIARRVANEGHEIATHTWSHKNLAKISQGDIASQLRKSVDIIERVTGQEVTTLRPPYGAVNSDVRAAARHLGLKIVNWSIDTEDWKTNNADATHAAIMNHVKNGSIVLCHDTKGSSATAMARVIPELIEKGYQLVTVSELLSFSETHGQPGTLYTHLDTSHLQ